MDLLETRELRYFIAVAEELHFGRAAARLLVAQPALSKTIQGIEARLGVQLLSRSSRRVSLTPAGAALLEHGRHALNAVTVAIQNAQRASEHAPLRLVIKPGGDANLLSGILASYARQPAARQVDIVFSGSTDRTTYLRDGRADVALLYIPFDDASGLITRTLHVEDRVAVLSDQHPLATRHEIGLDELAGETFPRWRGMPNRDEEGPEITDAAELIPLVRIGRVVAVLPRSLIAPVPPGIACVRVHDAGSSRIAIARNEHDRRASVAALFGAASAIAAANTTT